MRSWPVLICALAGAGCPPPPVASSPGGPVDRSAAGEGPDAAVDTATRPSDTDAGGDADVVDTPDPFGQGFVRVDDVLGGLGLEVAPGERLSGGYAPAQTAGVVGDLDGDGVQDVLVLGLRPADARFAFDARGSVVLTWDAGLDRLVPSELSVQAARDAFVPLGVMDIDGDGRADLVGQGGNVPVWFGGTDLQDSPAVDVPAARLDAVRGVVPADLDGDGLLDLVMTTSCASTDGEVLVAWQEGPRRWHVAGDVVDGGAAIAPYTLLFAPVGDDDTVLHVLGSPCRPDIVPDAFYRPSGTSPDGRTRLGPYDPTPRDATYKMLAISAGGPLTGVNPMGETTADLDGDGELELFVSTSRDRLDVFSQRAGALVERTAELALLHPVNPGVTPGTARWGQFHLPWSLASVDVDLDGRQELMVQYGDDRDTWLRGLTPNLALRVWWNAGGDRFVPIEDALGVGAPFAGHALTVGDLDGDGRADIVQGGSGALPRVYVNRIDTDRHALGLRLRGTTSNAEALGARVSVLVDGQPPQTFLVGGAVSEAAVAPPSLFAGLGHSAWADTVRVTWPTGLVQELHGVVGDRTVTLVEPQVVAIEPATRRAPADGVTTLRVRVQPMDGGGEPRAGTVQVRTVAGSAVAVDAPVADGLAWTVDVHAPQTPGSTQLEVAIDGTPLKVHPRLFWGD